MKNIVVMEKESTINSKQIQNVSLSEIEMDKNCNGKVVDFVQVQRINASVNLYASHYFAIKNLIP